MIAGNVKVQPCLKCRPHPFQDETYGAMKRVHTVGKLEGMGDKSSSPSNKATCTVCGNVTSTKPGR